MRQRKIDDDQLLDLLGKNRQQKEIAKILGVSEPAISKRIKKLLPSPESLHGLTFKEQRFVIEKAKGNTATQAALMSFDVSSIESAKVIGSQLLARPGIKAAISDLMEYHGLSPSYRVGRLKTHCDSRDPHVSIKAIQEANKMDGQYAPTKVINENRNNSFTQVNIDLSFQSDKKD